MRADHAGVVAKAVGWTCGCILAPVLLGAMFGPRWIGIGALIAVVATLWVTFWLPRSAAAAFAAGSFVKARRRYGVLGQLAFTRGRERAAALSVAACDVALDVPQARARGLAQLMDLDEEGLDPPERVVWLNNRACAALDAGDEPTTALALAEEATRLRPDVPAVQHTRARALLAVGRVDEAISVLDAMRAGGELAPRLEAERCRDLALAWDRKGHRDYADDYRARASLSGIGSLR